MHTSSSVHPWCTHATSCRIPMFHAISRTSIFARPSGSRICTSYCTILRWNFHDVHVHAIVKVVIEAFINGELNVSRRSSSSTGAVGCLVSRCPWLKSKHQFLPVHISNSQVGTEKSRSSHCDEQSRNFACAHKWVQEF